MQHNYDYNLAVRLSLPSPLTPPGSITPGLRTAAVVLSSLGVGLPFLVLVTLIGLNCYILCDEHDYISRAKKWLARGKKRRQKTNG